MHSDTQLFIDGHWRPGHGGQAPVLNPANEEQIGSHAVADRADLDDALAAALRGFAKWRSTSAFERSKVMRRAAELLRERQPRLLLCADRADRRSHGGPGYERGAVRPHRDHEPL
jgi:succinate-semialdehyde dehydrogenase / glutarate-semialdehyde dehydrogenase